MTKDCRHKLVWEVRPQGAWANCDKCEMRVIDMPNRVFDEIRHIGMNQKAGEIAETLKALMEGGA